MKSVLVLLLAGLLAPVTALAATGDMSASASSVDALSTVWSSNEENELPDPSNPPPREPRPE